MSLCALDGCEHPAFPLSRHARRRYQETAEALAVFCATCRQRMGRWLRWHPTRELGDAIAWLRQNPDLARTCSWCGGPRGRRIDEDGDRICERCLRLAGPGAAQPAEEAQRV